MTFHLGRRPLAAPFTLVTGFGALFALGAVAAALRGGLPGAGVLAGAAVVVGVVAFAGEPRAAAPLGVIGWLTVVGFSRPPYAELRPTGALAGRAAIVMAAVALGGAAAGVLSRSARRYMLVYVGTSADSDQPGARPALAGPPPAVRGSPAPGAGPAAAAPADPALGRRASPGDSGDAVVGRRRWLGIALAAAGLPLATLGLLAARHSLSLTDDLLIYLVAVVALAVIGGFWPAVLAAVAASMLVNWFFTPPVHTFTIDRPDNLLALVLFVTVAVAVSSVVHLAARRAVQAARSREEAASLQKLAQTVLGGSDTPAAVLGHLTATFGGRAELREQVSGRWVPVAASQGAPAAGGGGKAGAARVDVRPGLSLEVAGQSRQMTAGLLSGFAAQAAAALDRERLRTQAAQAEALAEGNRMRTALLAAVSHDLRTPLASIKASVSSLRQTDVDWTDADRETLLATTEENADRLDGLIGNLLDMSRLHTGSLQPFLRPVGVDEVAPVALRGLDTPSGLAIAVPDGLPLVLADPGLLERVLANLFSNALRHSPPERPAALVAREDGASVLLQVIDHGAGVPDGRKERIFEPFQRFDSRHPGVGLGLAVAKGFTEAMGGTIAASDTRGGGLTITVRLPASARAREPARRVDQ